MRLELRPELRLQLTPQLMLNLKLLQMTSIDLEQELQQELEANPALEVVPDEPEAEASPEPETRVIEAPDSPDEPAPAPQDLLSTGAPDKETPELENLEGALGAGEVDIADFLQDDGYVPPLEPMQPRASRDSEPTEPEGMETLRLTDVLLPQLRAQFAGDELLTAEALVDNLDEDGFLAAPEEELARQLNRPPEEVSRILHVIRRLEGGGIGARSVPEALMLQLEVMGYARDSIEYRVLVECYELMVHRQYLQIARALATSEDRVREAVECICRLEPKPGRRYTGMMPGFIQPDFCVEWDGDQLRFYATEENVPRLRLARRYREILASPKTFPRDEVEFARKKCQNALMFLRGIESRRRTLARVMKLILERQHEFFVSGREHLKPISIKDSGKDLGIHPSTISRAVHGKHVATPFAILPMRFFFSTGTDGHARHSVKDKLKRMIEAESRETPFSDEELCSRLAEQGIRLSRRTVAKYRAEMGIAGCNDRGSR